MINSVHYYATSAFFNGLCAAFLVYYVYLRNRKNPLNQSFLIFGISVAGWSLIYSFWAWATDARLAEVLLRIHMMFEALIPATFFHFSCVLTERAKKLKRIIFIAYGISTIYACLMLTPLMIEGVKKILIFDYWPAPGPLLFSHVLVFFSLVILAHSFLVAKFLRASGLERQQTFLVLLACLIGFGGGSVNWFLWFDIPIPPMTNFFVGIMFVITAYVMIRYGLMDVDAVVEMIRSSRSAALGLIASSMNHELRNPLFIAKGKIESHLDAVEQKIFSDEKEENIKSRQVMAVCHEQLVRAMDVMQRFAGFAKPTSSPIKKEKVELEPLIETVLRLVASEIELREVTVKYEGLRGLCICADRRHLEEVIFNLIMNACHALEGQSGSANENSKTIRITATESVSDIAIEISDNGPGIAPDNLKKIFEPFFTTKGEKGTGLGLYITKQLVERNSGKISVTSKVGKGTTFRLVWPRRN